MPMQRIAQDDGWKELARAIVRRAGEDAKRGSPDAIYWLLDEQIQDSYISVAGVDSRAVVRLAKRAERRVIRIRARQILAEATQKKDIDHEHKAKKEH